MSDIGKSLTQFLTETQRQQAVDDLDLIVLIDQIASACKQIANLVERSYLLGLDGFADTENVQGETQKKLDIVSNQVMIDHLNWSGQLAGMVSEEVEDIIPIPTKYPKGRYLICFDPLDGSSNLDLNLSVGSIFSILRATKERKTPALKDFLQQGTQQVCAGFAVYGPATMLILTIGHGVQGFTLDNTRGEFILTHPEMRIPKDTAEFAINASNQRFWEPPVQRYVEECLQGVEGVRQKNFNMRWLASMVAEVFRILTRGGVFMYPLDSKNVKQGGRLRLLYEANPMSWIVEQAGGLSTTGKQRILELQPEAIHQRVPIILGSKTEVERIVEYHQQSVVS